MSQDENSLIFAETWKAKLSRLFLKGEKKGIIEPFGPLALPGLPDNIASDRKGNIWVAFPARTSDIRKFEFTNSFPSIRRMLWKFPRDLAPKPTRYGFAARFDEKTGTVLESFHDPSGEKITTITTIRPHDNYLYFGGLTHMAVSRIPYETQ